MPEPIREEGLTRGPGFLVAPGPAEAQGTGRHPATHPALAATHLGSLGPLWLLHGFCLVKLQQYNHLSYKISPSCLSFTPTAQGTPRQLVKSRGFALVLCGLDSLDLCSHQKAAYLCTTYFLMNHHNFAFRCLCF